MRYIIAPDVFYRTYDETTVVYQTDSKKVSIYNGSTKDIINCFKHYSTIEECLADLQKKFGNLSDTEELKQFIQFLEEQGILQNESILIEDRAGAENYFRDHLQNDGQIYSVLMELTYRCNEKCRHCYCVDNDNDELTTQEIKHVLDELEKLNVLEITFTGGDLFVRKDAYEILEYAYSKNFLITIFTNGIALKDADIFRLKSIHLKSIHFSVYSHIAEKHDYVTQVPGSFEKTISAIRKCILIGIPVNIKSVMMEYNYSDAQGLMDLASELGATIQVGVSVNAKNDGSLEPTFMRMSSVEKYAEVIEKIDNNIMFVCGSDLSEDNLTEKDLQRDIICHAGKRAISINPYGDVFACNAFVKKCGNIRESSIKDIWENSAVLNEIRSYKFSDIKGCENCEDKIYCNFCPGAALGELGDALCRYEEACTIMRAKKIVTNRKGGKNNV